MNERIKALVAQAGILQPERFDAIDGSNQLDKLAELIVKECIDAIDAEEYTMGGDTEAKGMRFSISIIKAHFGVQE